jgi:hypothetical protein
MGAQALAASAQSPADRLRAAEAIDPPFQHGDGSDVAERGLELTVPSVDVLADFHGCLDNPQLVLFASGNYFFALGQAVEAFARPPALSRAHLLRDAASTRRCRPASCSSRWRRAERSPPWRPNHVQAALGRLKSQRGNAKAPPFKSPDGPNVCAYGRAGWERILASPGWTGSSA